MIYHRGVDTSRRWHRVEIGKEVVYYRGGDLLEWRWCNMEGCIKEKVVYQREGGVLEMC